MQLEASLYPAFPFQICSMVYVKCMKLVIETKLAQ